MATELEFFVPEKRYHENSTLYQRYSTRDIRTIQWRYFLVGSFILSDLLVSCSPSFIHEYATGYLFTVSHIKITSCSTGRHFRLAITDGHWNVNEKGHRKSQFGIQYTSDVWKLLKLSEPLGESKGNIDSGRFRNKSWPSDAIYVALWVNDLMRTSTNFIGLMIVGSNNSFKRQTAPFSGEEKSWFKEIKKKHRLQKTLIQPFVPFCDAQ